MTSKEAYIALNMIDEVGPVRVRALLDRFGTPEAILGASRQDLMRVEGVGEQVARNITGWREAIDLEAELKRIEDAGVRVVTRDDAEYPASLHEIYDPPLVLYVRGTLSDRDKRSIGIVGSRRATIYGREMAKKLAAQLAHVGITVVSGLARGVDTAAHTGALQGKGRTVAVIGCGIDVDYPPENKKLAGEIVEKGGAVVSEFPFKSPPDAQNFPMRNRIISGWCTGVVVVEADIKSGALITAKQAHDQGREVFAVPGRADAPLSRGTNRLIKDGAKLTEDVEDILGEFQYLFPKEESASVVVELSEIESKIVSAIGQEEVLMDDIIRATGLTSAAVSATLLGLEMKRVVKQLPGRQYARNPALNI